MANKITDVSRVPNQASGTYYREVDLTVVTKTTGGFSGALVGLTEKGPAFQISNSATYEDRAFRLGELNPKFLSSYYARQFLEQSRNLKEIRILGLEGYSDTVGFGISYAVSGSTAATTGTAPLLIGTGGLACVLKKRSTTVTGRLAITKVEVEAVTYTDPTSGLSVTAANDYLFGLRITYSDTSTELIVTSLRPESNEYIVKKFSRDPLEVPTIKGLIATLWVDFIIPSVKSRPDLSSSLSYYLPGSNTPQSTLALLEGNITFGTSTTLQSGVINNVLSTGTYTKVVITGDVTAWLANNNYLQVVNVSGTGPITQVNGIWKVDQVAFSTGNTEARLLDRITGDPLILSGSITFSNSLSPLAYKFVNPTWETEILDFSGINFQTPLTPWFISDGDSNGDYKRLFRLWSISDGKSANTEIKIEISRINPAGNNGKGTFDVLIRKWSDREDLNPIILESFLNLTIDPKSDNYVLRRIGDGENYPLKSRFVFIEMNEVDEIEGQLPYGVLGYPNATGKKVDEFKWTKEYDKNQLITKQSLGLPNNKINAFKEVTPDQLTFIRSTGVFGKGFHLNPNNNAGFVTAQSANFVFANQNIYTNTASLPISATEKVKRCKFVVDFFGGFDGWNVYSERTWDDANSKDYEALQTALELLKDKESLDSDFSVLVTPDIYIDTHPSAVLSITEMVKERGDALYIPDLSYDDTADITNAISIVSSSQIKDNHVAVYFPWLQMEDPINKVSKWCPPSLMAFATIAYVANQEQVWQPPAGSIRTVTNNLIRSRKRLKQTDREALKAVNINGITPFPGSGYEITESRTQQEDYSALSFIHNRMLIGYARKVLNQVTRPLLHQLNGEVTKDAFLTTVRPIFDRIKKLNGLEDYSVDLVDAPEATDRNTLYGTITLVPLYAVERIVLTFTLQNGAITTQ